MQNNSRVSERISSLSKEYRNSRLKEKTNSFQVICTAKRGALKH